MKKYFLLIAFFSAWKIEVNAQARSGSVAYNKIDQPALVLQLPHKEDIAEDFILDNLKKTGYDVETKGKLFWKKNKLDGFYIFKGVMLPGANTPLDLYFKVDEQGKKSKNASTVYMLSSRGGENFINSNDSFAYEASKKFLNNFVSESAAYKLNLDVDAQEKVVKDAEKQLSKLIDDEKDMEKKIEELQRDIKKNKEDQANQQQTIEAEKKKLADLKAKAMTM
ncbi:MAG TPA: hypothetical protein VNA26_08865 [Chitinophagaceae bacterium]|nr:hypothetical protein [Chitinophagaceae bacterium]